MAYVFDEGKFPFKFITEETPFSSCFDSSAPPKPLLIATPTVSGTYPVLLLLHGFYLRNYFYKGILQHIASHGFIVVGPQLYSLVPATGPEEIESAAKVVNWLPEGLQSLLPENVVMDLTKFALSGHSRGGKAAFALALGYAKAALSLKFSVLIGIDPVAGANQYCRTNPHILTYVPRSFDLNIPVLVIGTGLGPEKKNDCMSQPCAPEGLNHKEFFNESKPPCAHFVAKDYGHMDMLDDDLPGVVGAMSGCMCKNGSGPKDLMRKSVGGIVVAFLNAYLNGEDGDLLAIVADPALSPARLEPAEFINA
ncbi:putative chlorophyllase [Rosa chinensis]|uniref:chlorophyllase n=1 Tax=Rosa chinensis TaxID=74649 RepID=A0A2P6PVS7_ROSCH|nr:chlorophyllase-1 [Rosa chinensis]XP_040364283.1 chlorophyllase-1 [Rosa chinensis]PRQ26030.1 putative chlorophyllase [Rosa chinensis]